MEQRISVMVILFEDDEAGYLRWINEHPDGYVVNTRRWFDPDYLVLHRASCSSIKIHRNMHDDPGGFTERNYRKLCSASLSDLEDHLRKLIGNGGTCGPIEMFIER